MYIIRISFIKMRSLYDVSRFQTQMVYGIPHFVVVFNRHAHTQNMNKKKSIKNVTKYNVKFNI